MSVDLFKNKANDIPCLPSGPRGADQKESGLGSSFSLSGPICVDQMRLASPIQGGGEELLGHFEICCFHSETELYLV